MYDGEWSRSRYWLCHFLQNRHERVAIDWQDSSTSTPTQRTENPNSQAALANGLVPWVNPVDSMRQRRWLLGEAVRTLGDDPAYIQCLRLFTKEEQYHRDLTDRCRTRLNGLGKPKTSGPIKTHLNRAWRASRRVLGMRFELSIILLTQILAVAYWRLLAKSPAGDPIIKKSAQQMMRDKLAHIDFQAERLTLEFTAFNFIRRNLRRWRLRMMFGAILMVATCRQGRYIRAMGVTRMQFMGQCWTSFAILLEKMVPYRRTELINALLHQRQHPYEKQQHIL
jgi:hypothetical protein